MEMIDKIVSMMRELDINRADLSKHTGIPYTTIDGLFKKGTENIKRSTITKLANYFKVTIDYLANDEITDKNYNKTAGFTVEYNEMLHIKKYRELDSVAKGAVESLLDYLYKNKISVQKTRTYNKPTRRIPYYLLPASAGVGEYMESGDRDVIDIPDIPMYEDVNFAVRVSGDSMEPEYKNGDVVLIVEQPMLDYGDIGLFMLNNEGYIKKYDRKGLVSLNKQYDPIKISDYDVFKVSGKIKGVLGQED